jgi:hypothetical protein
MDQGERELLHQTVLDALVSKTEVDACDRALAGLGWLDMLRDEPRDAVAIVFHALGATNGASSVLDDVLVAALGMEPAPDLAVMLPRFGLPGPPGDEGLATAWISRAKELLVVGATSAARVPLSAVDVSAVVGIDPAFGLHRVRVDAEAADAITPPGGAWPAALAAGQVALAHQIAGACRTMLELARTHALERVQFDRPIAQFQAVRHRLADVLVAIEALDAALVAAQDAPGPTTAALAKAAAGRSARTTSMHCQQVLAGIGFTTDHPFHLFMKRTMTLDGLLGSADQLTFEIGRGLLADRRVPSLIEL